MAEYIEREAVNALIKAECSPKVAAYLIDAVATIYAADVRPVVHGRWEHDGFNWFCNRCNYNALCDKDTGEEVLSPRCPNCGSDMMEES